MIKHIFLVLVLMVSYYLWDQRPVKHGFGVVAPEAPTLVKVSRTQNFEIDHYTLNSSWRLETTARVLSQKRYWLDEKTHLSPVDFVLGWGSMSDERVLSQVQAPVKKREYTLDVIRPPLTLNEIRQQILFMHAIPANDTVRSQLNSIRTGNVVTVKGYIVDIKDRSNIIWTSSLSANTPRLDNRQIVYIQSLEIQ